MLSSVCEQAISMRPRFFALCNELVKAVNMPGIGLREGPLKSFGRSCAKAKEDYGGVTRVVVFSGDGSG